MAQWPAPVIRFYLGQLTADALIGAADDPNPHTKAGQLCEANFFSGERALQQGAKDEAARLFHLAVTLCPQDFDERAAAGAELKALGAAK